MNNSDEADKPLKILVVEDEVLLALDLESHLIAMGHRVIGVASDAADAFALAENEAVDLALVDLNLRDGFTGPQIATKLAHEHGVVVIFVTGSSEQIPADYAGALGAIAKPWSAETLVQLVPFVRARARKTAGTPPPALALAPSLRDADGLSGSTLL